MRVLHPASALYDDYSNMAAVAQNDLSHTSTADVAQQHHDLALLVNSLSASASPAPNHDSNPASEQHSQDVSRPPSTNPTQTSPTADQSAAAQPSVQQQAQMAIQSILATAQRKNSGQDPVWSMTNATSGPEVDATRSNGQVCDLFHINVRGIVWF